MDRDEKPTNGMNRRLPVALPLGVLVVLATAVVGVADAGSPSESLVSRSRPAPAQPAGRVRPARPPREATATLRAADGSLVGTVRFRRRGGLTLVDAKLKLPAGLTALDAFHGFHVHANDKPENGEGCLADPAQPPATWFVSADGHLAEPGQGHGQHTGDMPSLLVNDDGSALIEFTSSRLDVAGLANRAVVLHAGPDNFANVPTGPGTEQYTANSMAATSKTAATGNAGNRIACGVVSITR